MSEYIPDYNDLFNEFEAEQEQKEKKLPKCDCCGKRISTDKFFNVEGTYICPSCIEDFIVDTEDYMED
jgi:formylmethanofuran dehydrogenase subunit E